MKKRRVMQQILTSCSATIAELKENPAGLLNKLDNAPIAIRDHDRTIAYLVPAETWDWIMDQLDDFELGCVVRERADEMSDAVNVRIDEEAGL